MWEDGEEDLFVFNLDVRGWGAAMSRRRGCLLEAALPNSRAEDATVPGHP